MNDLQEFFENKKVLITGHTGFKGGWLTQILLSWQAEIVGLSLKPNTDPSLFNLLGIKNKIKNYFVDIRDFQKVKKIITKEKPEIIFHLAAQPLVRDSYRDPIYTFETNILGTAYVLQSIKEEKSVRSAVMITTDKVYKEKESVYFKEDDKIEGYDPYSSSKAGCEMIINSYIKSFFNPKDYGGNHNALIASARAGNVIGGGDWSKDRIVPDIIRSVFEKNEEIIIRSPNSIRPWQHVLEPLLGYLLLAKELYNGEKNLSGAWNFGPDEDNYLTVENLVKRAIEIFKKGSYVVKKDQEWHEVESIRLNIDKAKNLLGWQPIFKLDQTLDLTFSWYKSFYNKENILNLTNQQIKLFFKEK